MGFLHNPHCSRRLLDWSDVSHFKCTALESMNSRETLGMGAEEVRGFLFIYFLLSRIVLTLVVVHDTAFSHLYSSLASSGDRALRDTHRSMYALYKRIALESAGSRRTLGDGVEGRRFFFCIMQGLASCMIQPPSVVLWFS